MFIFFFPCLVSGCLYTWGSGDFGQLGIDVLDEVIGKEISTEVRIQKNTPHRVKEALLQENVISVACGSFHTLALTSKIQTLILCTPHFFTRMN
jgi:alpha-tubulin suppressor-like RCC1 family protein